MRILAVDDDPVILDLLQDCLNKSDDYELVCAGTAEEALELAQNTQTPFDCFLLDIMLPGIDGIEMCQTIRKQPMHLTTPIIMITASREVDLMGRAFAAGATDFVSKPLDGLELGTRVRVAAMLNQSLMRERDTRHSLAEMSELVRIRFEDPFALDVPEMSDLLALENHLLRMAPGCYAMTLFSAAVDSARGIYGAVRPTAFRNQMTSVGQATATSLDGLAYRLAYAGKGRFVGIVFSRNRLDETSIQTGIHAALETAWDVKRHDAPSAPQVNVELISRQRLWSGLSACDMMQAYLTKLDPLRLGPAEHEENLFARLSSKFGGEKTQHKSAHV